MLSTSDEQDERGSGLGSNHKHQDDSDNDSVSRESSFPRSESGSTHELSEIGTEERGERRSVKVNELAESGSEDEKEEDEEENGMVKSAPYHVIGACCFCSSIIVGIACVIVTTILAAQENPDNNALKWIFGAFFGTFIFFLFLCLCCTYYLGASKESWEIPTFNGIRRNFSNFVALVGLVIEFLQICSFSFNRTLLFSGYDVSWVHYIAVPVGEGSNSEVFETLYWLMFVIAFTPYIFVIVVRIIIYVYTIRKGENSAAKIVDKLQEKIHSVLWFLVNTLYFPVIGTMLAGSDCTFADDQITLDAKQDIMCLKGQHIAILVCSQLALIIYYPAASFAQAQTQSISDIKFKPRIVFVMLQGKFLLALTAIFFTSQYVVYFPGVMVINIMFLVLNIVGQPCLVRWVNRMRTLFFAMALWATVCSVMDLLMAEESIIPAILLCVVWGIMLIGFPLFFILWERCGAVKSN